VRFEGSVSNIGDETTTSFVSFQNSSLVQRKDLDFTEKLWNFCQGDILFIVSIRNFSLQC